jgi:hypothetical protein
MCVCDVCVVYCILCILYRMYIAMVVLWCVFWGDIYWGYVVCDGSVCIAC